MLADVVTRARKRDRYGSSIETDEYHLSLMPGGTLFFSYNWISAPTEHRIGSLTPDVDMLRYSHRYALCGFGPIDLHQGHRCVCDGNVTMKQPHCQRCEVIWNKRKEKTPQ